jgi:aminopeptidase N
MKKIVVDDNVRDLLNFRVEFAEACKISEQGELRVAIPDKAIPEEAMDPGEQGGPTLCIWSVTVEFELAQPRGGLVFAGSAMRGHPPLHCYTDGQCGGARMWFPCVDSIAASNPFELRVVVPRGYTVVCSVPSVPGEERQEVRKDPGKVRWKFRTVGEDGKSYELPARAIGLAAGPFLRMGDPGVPDRMTHYCLPFPNAEQDLAFSTQFLSRALLFLEQLLSPLPWNRGTLAHVFVEHPPDEAATYPGLTIADAGLLHDPSVVEQTFATVRALVRALARQWFGLNGGLRPADWGDVWVLQGLAGHVANLCLRKLEGHNAYVHHIWEETEAVCELDHPGSAPLVAREGAGYAHPVELVAEARARKAALVVRLVDKKIGEANFRKLLAALLERRADRRGGGGAAGAGGAGGLAGLLFRLVRKGFGQDVEPAMQQWIAGAGCPVMTANFLWNRKRNQVEFAMRVNNEAVRRLARDTLTVRVHETEVAPRPPPGRSESRGVEGL